MFPRSVVVNTHAYRDSILSSILSKVSFSPLAIRVAAQQRSANSLRMTKSPVGDQTETVPAYGLVRQLQPAHRRCDSDKTSATASALANGKVARFPLRLGQRLKGADVLSIRPAQATRACQWSRLCMVVTHAAVSEEITPLSCACGCPERHDDTRPAYSQAIIRPGKEDALYLHRPPGRVLSPLSNRSS